MQTFLCSLIHHISSISWCAAPFSYNCQNAWSCTYVLPHSARKGLWDEQNPAPWMVPQENLSSLSFSLFSLKRQFSRIELRFTGQRGRKNPTNAVINLSVVVESNSICVPREGLCFMIQQRLDATRPFELVPNSIETHSSGKRSHLILQST